MNRFTTNVYLVMRKELGALFSSPVAYLFLVAFLVGSAVNLVFFQRFFEVGQATLRSFFEWMPWVFLLLVPPLTMRIWSEERREGTIELLLTLPIDPSSVLLGKFLAAWSFLTIALILTLPLPLIVAQIGALDLGPVIGGYLGSVLLGGAFIAIGMCVSALAKNQILSFLLSAVTCLLFLVIGTETIMAGNDVMLFIGRTFGFGPHFDAIARGLLETKDLIYFGSLVFFFLVVNRYLVGSYRYA
jgi:ABC-2 type transport system permease protein